MTLAVLTHLEIIDQGTTYQVTAHTDLPTSWYLCIQPNQPTRTPRYKMRRGVRIVCGFTLEWAPTLCTLQAEPLAGQVHTYVVPKLAAPDDPWGIMTETLPIAIGTQAISPIRITPNVFPPPFIQIIDSFTRPDTCGDIGNTESPVLPWITYGNLLAAPNWEIANHQLVFAAITGCSDQVASTIPQAIVDQACPVTNQEVYTQNGPDYITGFGSTGPISRWVDALNFLYGAIEFGPTPTWHVRIYQVTAGIPSLLAQAPCVAPGPSTVLYTQVSDQTFRAVQDSVPGGPYPVEITIPTLPLGTHVGVTQTYPPSHAIASVIATCSA